MELKRILDVLDHHEQQIELTSAFLDETHRKLLSDSFTMAKRMITNSNTISFVSYFDALSNICSARFDKTYSRYATNFDLKHQEKSLCYVIFTKAYPRLPEDRAGLKYDQFLSKCIDEKNGGFVLNQRKFESRYVLKWLNRIRPEQKIFLVTAFNTEKIIKQFSLEVLQDSSHELIELANHTMMASAFVASLANEDGLYSKEKLTEVCKGHAKVIMHLTAPVNSILSKDGIAGLTGSDIPKLDKALKGESIKRARGSRKRVDKSVREEWRQFALENWPSLEKPNNQVGNMAKLIKESLESASNFEEVTIGDNLNNIKKQALARK